MSGRSRAREGGRTGSLVGPAVAADVTPAVTPAAAADVAPVTAADVPPVTVVGVPVTGVSNMEARGRAALAGATLLCGAARHLEAVPAHGEERVVLGDVGACVDRLRRRAPGERCVVLASGDPLCYGIGATLLRELGAEQVRVVPAVSSVQEAFALGRVPWHGARILSAHGRELGPVVAAAMASEVCAILCGPEAPPRTVAAALRAAGMEDCRAVVAARLGTEAQEVLDARLSTVAARELDEFAVLVLDRGAGAAGERRPAPPRFGRPESEFSHAGGMITRAEVRAVVLAALDPAGSGVIWDVGAGSGSIGIEAAALAPAARVLAVERDPGQLAHLRANVAALAPGGRVEVVAGEAPAALAALADPDRVVVGGHGGRLPEILGVVLRRLPAGGRVVCSLATLDGAITALTALAAWEPALTQVGIARGVPAGRATRLRAEDPVFVVAAERPR